MPISPLFATLVVAVLLGDAARLGGYRSFAGDEGLCEDTSRAVAVIARTCQKDCSGAPVSIELVVSHMNDEGRRTKGIPSLVAFAMMRGVRPDELIRAVGLDLERVVAAPEEAISHHARVRLWDEAARLAGDPDFGLHMAEWTCERPEDHFDLLVYAVRSCATLGEHYQRMERYVRLLHAGTYMALEVEADVARFRHGLRDGTLPSRHPVECMLTIAVLQARRTTGDDFAPKEVRFAHAAPASTSEQERVFRAPVYYGCAHNELVLDAADLHRPQTHAEPGLQAVLERQLEEMMSKLPDDATLSARVKHHLADKLIDGEPAVSAVAAKMRVSSRTLQRRLTDEGTSFAKLLTDVRRDIAMRRLQNERTTINEVAFLLGFVEVSAFHRAFKRWTGQTPAEYRRSLRRS